MKNPAPIRTNAQQKNRTKRRSVKKESIQMRENPAAQIKEIFTGGSLDKEK